MLDDVGDALGNQLCVSGVDFDDMGQDEQQKLASRVALFSRVEPNHKTRLVELLKQQV